MQTDDGLFALIQLACCFNGIRDWLLIRRAREYCRSPTKLVDLGGSVIRLLRTSSGATHQHLGTWKQHPREYGGAEGWWVVVVGCGGGYGQAPSHDV